MTRPAASVRALAAARGDVPADLLLTGGREMNVAMKSTGALAYTMLDESIPRLDVQFLGS